jgi:hypothetical protein
MAASDVTIGAIRKRGRRLGLDAWPLDGVIAGRRKRGVRKHQGAPVAAPAT